MDNKLVVDHPFKTKKNSYLHQGFLNSVERYPYNTALIINGVHKTFEELYKIAVKWANIIESHSTGPMTRIGIFSNESEVAYIGILASLFTGATYIPLNSKFPLERTQSMIDAASLDAIIVDSETYSLYERFEMELNEKPSIVFAPESKRSNNSSYRIIDKHDLEAFNGTEKLNPDRAGDTAYILFTSGSTGRPKGVPISHENVNHLLEISQDKYQINSMDRITQSFDLTFDLSVFSIFMAWNHGAAVCPMSSLQQLSPYRFINKNDITVWFSVPSIIPLLQKQKTLKENRLNNLRLSLFCGEPLLKESVQAWKRAAPNSVIENLYGPTELTIYCSTYTWDEQISPSECDYEVVPIGKVNEDHQYCIVNEEMSLVSPGEVGELCVSGPQMFSGYLNNENKEYVFLQKGEQLYYLTGDLVKENEYNNLIFLGRKDNQVKVNGYRVECGEVEAAISSQHNVVQAIVVPFPYVNGGYKGLVAFVIGENIEPQEIIRSTEEVLPRYMVPTACHVLDTFPTNPNGKIDRKQLYSMLNEGSV